MFSGNQHCGKLSAARWVAALTLALLQLLQLCPTFAAGAPPSLPDVRMAFSKNSYWYEPDGKIQTVVTLDNRSRQSVKGVSIRFRVYTKNRSRSDLDDSLGKIANKSYKQTETPCKNLSLKPGNNTFNFEVQLARGRYANGIYPFKLEALKGSAVLSRVVSEIIVFSSKDLSNLKPLRVSLVFDTLSPPHRGPDDVFKSDELAAECDSTGKQPGWYSTLLWAVNKWPELNLSFSMSPMLLEEISDMSKGYVVKRGDKEFRVSPDSRQAKSASSVLGDFRILAQSPRCQMLPAPYASPNLENLISLRWTTDARQQLTSGHKALEKDLDTTVSREFFYPPGLAANTRVLRDLDRDAGKFLLLSPELLQRSKAGMRLARGYTLAQPVNIMGAKKGGETTAVFADARMQSLLARLSKSADPHGITQCILSELTSLYFEQPDKLRSCAVVWPARWRPSREIVSEIFAAVAGSPWLKTNTLAESMMTVPILENDPLEIPEPSTSADEYFTSVTTARGRCKDFSTMVTRDNPLLLTLRNNVSVSESDVWRQWDRKVEGLSWATSVINTIDGEIKKINMPSTGSINLTSASAKIPLSVINGASYPITATLTLSSNGLEFPEGSRRKIKLEPKENLLEIPVAVKKKGRIRFQARLQARNLIIGEVDTTVLTSRLNTFAFFVVIGLLVLIGGAWVAKTFLRRKAGKHKRRNIEQTNKKSA